MFTANEQELRQLLEAVGRHGISDDTNVCALLNQVGSRFQPAVVGYAHLCLAIRNGEHFEQALSWFHQAGCDEEIDHILELALRYGEVDLAQTCLHLRPQEDDQAYLAIAASAHRQKTQMSRALVDEQFRSYSRLNGLTILRHLQVGEDAAERKSHVYLVVDEDQIVKIYKESLITDDWVLPEEQLREDQMHERLQSVHGLPRFYGSVEVAPDVFFLKMEMVYGQSLLDFVRDGRKMTVDEACFVTWSLARILAQIHASGYVYLDLRPQNVKIQGSTVRLLDLSSVQACEPGEPVASHLFDPRYSAPEMIMRHVASQKSDVFSLGALFVQLLTGQGPFLKVTELDDTGERQEGKILKFALPACMTVFSRELPDDPRCALIASMLDRDASKRPTMKEVVQALEPTKRVTISAVERIGKPRSKKKNSVLFPARMGLPHRGHIEYMARILELGFHLVIAIQRSYTSTELDPYPKWVVSKMVAQSLFDKGFSQNDFTIVLTPYFMTDMEVFIYYALMPGREDLVAVASDNPDVWKQFKSLPIYTQQAVFGIEGKRFRTRSWGSLLRASVRTGNQKVFNALVASGVTKIRSFDELVREDNCLPIEFLHGHVRVELSGSIEIKPTVVHRFDQPEQALLRQLEIGRDVEVIDRWSRNTCLIVNGIAYELVYLEQRLSGDHLFIRYQLNERTLPT